MSITKLRQKYDDLYERNPYEDPSYLVLVKVSGWKRLVHEFKLYHDNLPMLSVRKYGVYSLNFLAFLCQKLVANKIYQILVSLIIIFNIVLFVLHQIDEERDLKTY